MGDIADILGVQKGPELTDGQQATKIMEGAPGVGRPVKMKKPKGMSREVYDLVGPAGLLPAMETKKPISSGFKEKRVSATKGKWIWAPFNSTARSDNQTFYHWAKADVQYNDFQGVVELLEEGIADDQWQEVHCRPNPDHPTSHPPHPTRAYVSPARSLRSRRPLVARQQFPNVVRHHPAPG